MAAKKIDRKRIRYQWFFWAKPTSFFSDTLNNYWLDFYAKPMYKFAIIWDDEATRSC